MREPYYEQKTQEESKESVLIDISMDVLENALVKGKSSIEYPQKSKYSWQLL